MNEAAEMGRVLRRLYLTLFLRGRSSRGLQRDKAPKSVFSKLGMSLLMYALIGFAFLGTWNGHLFPFALQLHTMMLFFVAMFVAGATGEVLFNKEEAEILLHRPVSPQSLLRAKVRVMVEISLWFGVAFSLGGLFIGSFGRRGEPLFLLAHLSSTVLAALFCTGAVVLLYQLCLRWFGRERLDNLMATAQVVMIMVIVAGSQLAPRLMRHADGANSVDSSSPWLLLLPPAWFAGLDELLVGRFSIPALWLAVTAVVATGLVCWLAVVRLAGSYQSGLQTLSESRAARPSTSMRGGLGERVALLPGVSWLLRDPRVASGFRLSAAYLFRDRDTKLRFYPGIAPMCILPIVFLFSGSTGSAEFSGFGVALSSAYLSTLPVMGLQLLQYSQNWQASDVFRFAPMPGPGPLIHGARHAVMVFVAIPAVLVLLGIVVFLPNGLNELPLLLPGIIAMPVYAFAAAGIGKTIPLFRPTEEARSAARSVWIFGMMMSSFAISGAAFLAWKTGWFWVFVPMELLIATLLCLRLRKSIDAARWPSME